MRNVKRENNDMEQMRTNIIENMNPKILPLGGLNENKEETVEAEKISDKLPKEKDERPNYKKQLRRAQKQALANDMGLSGDNS